MGPSLLNGNKSLGFITFRYLSMPVTESEPTEWADSRQKWRERSQTEVVADGELPLRDSKEKEV